MFWATVILSLRTLLLELLREVVDADAHGRNGSDYKTILTHYYTGTEIKKIPLE